MGDELHDFFVASAGVAGALIGLLFVAISVSQDRLTARGGQVHRIRAAGALTSFTNALVVSLFALVPDQNIGTTLVAVAAVGLAFVAGAVLSLLRVGGWRKVRFRDLLLLIGLAVVFGVQLDVGVRLGSDPQLRGAGDAVTTLVVICFLLGIARAYELIGGPSVDLRSEIKARVQERRHHGDDDHHGAQDVDVDAGSPPADSGGDSEHQA